MTSKEEKIFFELHSDLPREGPGNFNSTKKAFSLLSELPADPVILDVGCGPGKQTLDLSQITNGKIIALDNHQPYLDELEKKIKEKDLSRRVSTKLGDMNDLPFDDNIFDVIWAEGSIYLMGFGKAMELWKKFLKPNGYIVFSELCWFKNERPEEIDNYWLSFYGLMHTIDGIIKFITDTDYKFIGSYVLPNEAWWEDYYSPLSKRVEELKQKYKVDSEALEIIGNESTEMEMHKKYSVYYGYSFFIVQKLS